MDLQKASQIIWRARSVADLPNTAHITHHDEVHSLNEAWKDVYSWLKDNDDDYFVTRVDLSISSASAIAGTVNQWLIDLPSDFAQIRDLSYQTQTSEWRPVQKFPPSMRDYAPGEIHYRLEGDKLWVIGGNTGLTSGTLRMRYYPPPALLTLPQQPYSYGASYTPPQKRVLSVPCWASYNRTLVYVGSGGKAIKAESITLATTASPVAIYTDANAVTNLFYYQGTLFWIANGAILSKDTDLTAALTAPTTVVAAAGVVAFHIVGGTIYYATATEVRSCTLAGASDALVGAAAAESLCVLGGVVYYVAGGALLSLSPAATLVASGASKVTCDETYLYLLNTDHTVDRVTTAGDVTQAASDVVALGPAALDVSNELGQISPEAPPVWVLPMMGYESLRLEAVDVSPDYDFTYPNNLVPEIMAHQCAVDFRTKGSKDAGGIAKRLGALWERFRSSVRRDEYQPVRINNAYPANRGWM